MYKVSDSYLRAIMASSVVASWSGTLTTKDGKTYAFEDADIMSDKSRYTHEICANTVLDIGTAYSAELVLGLYLDIDRYTLYNAEVKLYFTLYLDDEGTQKENVPLGIFTVKDTELSTNGVVLTAYDAMQNFSTEASFDLSGEPYDFLNVACRSCGVKLGMTQAEIRELPNGRTSISTYNSKETISTWTDAVGYIAQFLGGYAIIDTDGSLVIRQYKTTTTRVIDASWRYDLTLSDYETKYRAIKLYNMREKSYETYGSDVVADGLVYTIGKNPFLQFEQQSTRERIANNILGAINQFSYTPYTAHVPLDPALQVGDILEFTGGQAVEGKKSVITSIDLKLSSSMTIKGVGENPRLKAIQDSGGDSSEEIAEISKDISKINGSINSLIYDFNTEPIVVGQEETTVAMIPYYVTQDVDVEGHLKLNFKANGPSHLIIRFYDDQVEELWSPIETDIVKGDNEIGIPHSYLDRKVGYHSAFVTVQCTLSSFVLDTRGVYFTINAGSYAEPSDDLSMDVLDLSMRQLLESNGPDQIWFVGLENGEFTLSHRNYDPTNKQRIEITGVYNAGKALTGACEFDGEWVLRLKENKYTLETQDKPWIFWTNTENVLFGQIGDLESTRVTLDHDVINVSACKGYSSTIYKAQDQGLVVAYIKSDGTAWYRQYVFNTDKAQKIWMDAVQLDDSKWTGIKVTRLNDYRLSFELTSATDNLWLITDRTYVNQAMRPEIGITDNNPSWSGLTITGINDDFSGNKSAVSNNNADLTDETGVWKRATELYVDFYFPIALIDPDDIEHLDKVFTVTLNDAAKASAGDNCEFSIIDGPSWKGDASADRDNYKSYQEWYKNHNLDNITNGAPYSATRRKSRLRVTFKKPIQASRITDAVVTVGLNSDKIYFSDNAMKYRLDVASWNWIFPRAIATIEHAYKESATDTFIGTASIVPKSVTVNPEKYAESGVSHVLSKTSLVAQQTTPHNAPKRADTCTASHIVTATITVLQTGESPI